MNSPHQSQNKSNGAAAVDPIDQDAAHIDARSEDAPRQIEELIEHAEDLGRDASQPVDSETGDSEADPGDDEPELLPG